MRESARARSSSSSSLRGARARARERALSLVVGSAGRRRASAFQCSRNGDSVRPSAPHRPSFAVPVLRACVCVQLGFSVPDGCKTRARASLARPITSFSTSTDVADAARCDFGYTPTTAQRIPQTVRKRACCTRKPHIRKTLCFPTTTACSRVFSACSNESVPSVLQVAVRPRAVCECHLDLCNRTVFL